MKRQHQGQIDVLLRFYFYFHKFGNVDTELIFLILVTALTLHHCANEYIFAEFSGNTCCNQTMQHNLEWLYVSFVQVNYRREGCRYLE